MLENVDNGSNLLRVPFIIFNGYMNQGLKNFFKKYIFTRGLVHDNSWCTGGNPSALSAPFHSPAPSGDVLLTGGDWSNKGVFIPAPWQPLLATAAA